MNRIYKKFILIFIVIILIITIISITGCTKQLFVCEKDHKIVDELKDKIGKPKCTQWPTLKQKDAEKIAEKYVDAYVKIEKANANLINSYYKAGKYHVTLVVTGKEEAYQTVISVDKKTALVNCEEDCRFLEKTN